MELARQKALVAKLFNKNSVLGRVTVKNEALNASTPDQTQAVRVKLLTRKADSSNDAATIDAIVSATAFAIEGGELQVGGSTYDILSVEQTGVAAEHLLQKAVLRER
ncbi:hypothetical protein [uncultured Novosphingobium sp.]|uniref:hypothetical protein n=1 Tax=uncultured Novosphingobium sp. TaxID=292277 RepID=UPI00258705B1|nr:hypothetical protein [uncultured Novosphingobium sp.]